MSSFLIEDFCFLSLDQNARPHCHGLEILVSHGRIPSVGRIHEVWQQHSTWKVSLQLLWLLIQVALRAILMLSFLLEDLALGVLELVALKLWLPPEVAQQQLGLLPWALLAPLAKLALELEVQQAVQLVQVEHYH